MLRRPRRPLAALKSELPGGARVASQRKKVAALAALGDAYGSNSIPLCAPWQLLLFAPCLITLNLQPRPAWRRFGVCCLGSACNWGLLLCGCRAHSRCCTCVCGTWPLQVHAPALGEPFGHRHTCVDVVRHVQSHAYVEPRLLAQVRRYSLRGLLTAQLTANVS